MVRRTSVLLIFGSLCVAAGPAPTPETPARASNLHWDVDLSMAYLERFGRPDGVITRPSADDVQPVAVGQPRTLGLERLRIALAWDAPGSAALDMVLRPDAQNRALEPDAAPPVREFDSRSGAPYKEMPPIRLVDSYRMSLAAGSHLSAAVGVWEELAPLRASYRDVLAFGLGVRFPAKFSGLRLRWRGQGEGHDARAAANQGFTGDVYILQGDEDRAEERGTRVGQHDHGPVAKDPYYGGATYLSYLKGPLELGILGGFQDSAYNDGKRSEMEAELVAVYELTTGETPLKLSIDARMAQERWKGGELNIKDRMQTSISFTTATAIAPDQWALVGGHWGSSQNKKSDTELDVVKTTSGYQFDLGIASRLGPGLSATMMLTNEQREVKTPGGATSGGFVNSEGDRSNLRRMGLELRYLLDANS